MKKNRVTYSIRETTEKMLRKHAEDSGHTMSLIVDLAVEEYILRRTTSITAKFTNGDLERLKNYPREKDMFKVNVNGMPPIPPQPIEDKPLNPMRPQ